MRCRPQGIEIDFVVAPQFEMLQTRAAGQQVVGDVQHVIGFGVGQIILNNCSG